MKRSISFLLFFFQILLLTTQAQSLPRRVYLGIRMENLTDDARLMMGIKENRGVLISEVLPQSTALRAGFKKGDALLSINQKNVTTTHEVLAALSGEKGGNTFNYEIFRAGKIKTGTSVFTTFPEEKYTGLQVLYTESETSIGKQRIIITKTKTEKRLPLIVFIGGIGCYSLDSPFDTTRSEIQLLNKLSRTGYMCARLEKPGMGDNANYCKACNQVSFEEETNGYVQAVKTLKNRNDVDSSRVFIFGHSMGGVFAPIIAQKTNIHGIISYGTIGSNFIEYLAKTRRTIAEAYNMPPDETDNLIKDFCECSTYYFAEKLTTAQAAQKKPVCAEYMGIFDLRSREYNDQLYSYNIPALWKPFKGHALFLYGQSDFIASEDDHKILHQAVNFYSPGKAAFTVVTNSDHGMNLAPNFQQAQSNPGPYNPATAEAVLQWLKKINS